MVLTVIGKAALFSLLSLSSFRLLKYVIYTKNFGFKQLHSENLKCKGIGHLKVKYDWME